MTEQHTEPLSAGNAWVAAADAAKPSSAEHAAEAATAPDTRPVFVAAHGGAGATSWAAILDGVDGGSVHTWTASQNDCPVVLVARASVDGIGAAKAAIHRHGASAFSSVLAVPAGPGRVPRPIAAELKVLTGAVPVVKAPWLPRLVVKRAQHASTADLSAKNLTSITAALNLPSAL